MNTKTIIWGLIALVVIGAIVWGVRAHRKAKAAADALHNTKTPGLTTAHGEDNNVLTPNTPGPLSKMRTAAA